jgi:hypothetical protein
MRSSVGLFLFTALACYAQTATLTKEASPAEDPNLRSEAVRLMEQANRNVTPTAWGSNQQSVHFRVGHPDPDQPYEGDYTSDIGGPGQRRQEWRYGAFYQVQVSNGNAFKTLQAEGTSPGFLPTIPHLTPAWVGHFDHEDIIRSITNNGEGRRCIQFVTVYGDSRQENEACVNTQDGWLESIRIGDKTIRNSNFFRFGNASLPGHVEQLAGDTLVIALDQTVTPKEYEPDFFGPPNTVKSCSVTTRPLPIETPQPAPQTASMNVIDIVLTGIVNSESQITHLKPLDNLHPELNQEALDLVSKWKFSAGTCDGKPATMWVPAFVVHFKGR